MRLLFPKDCNPDIQVLVAGVGGLLLDHEIPRERFDRIIAAYVLCGGLETSLKSARAWLTIDPSELTAFVSDYLKSTPIEEVLKVGGYIDTAFLRVPAEVSAPVLIREDDGAADDLGTALQDFNTQWLGGSENGMSALVRWLTYVMHEAPFRDVGTYLRDNQIAHALIEGDRSRATTLIGRRTVKGMRNITDSIGMQNIVRDARLWAAVLETGKGRLSVLRRVASDPEEEGYRFARWILSTIANTPIMKTCAPFNKARGRGFLKGQEALDDTLRTVPLPSGYAPGSRMTDINFSH